MGCGASSAAPPGGGLNDSGQYEGVEPNDGLKRSSEGKNSGKSGRRELQRGQTSGAAMIRRSESHTGKGSDGSFNSQGSGSPGPGRARAKSLQPSLPVVTDADDEKTSPRGRVSMATGGGVSANGGGATRASTTRPKRQARAMSLSGKGPEVRMVTGWIQAEDAKQRDGRKHGHAILSTPQSEVELRWCKLLNQSIITIGKIEGFKQVSVQGFGTKGMPRIENRENH